MRPGEDEQTELFLIGLGCYDRTDERKSPMQAYDNDVDAGDFDDAGVLEGPDAFGASRAAFDELLATLGSAKAAGWTHDQLEEQLETDGRELLRRLYQDHLDLRALREQHAVATGRIGPSTDARGIAHRKVEPGHLRHLATVFGTVRVTRCAWRAEGARNLYPADAALNLPDRRHSHTLKRRAATEAVRGSFAAAEQTLTGSIATTSEQVISQVFDQADQRDPTHRRPWIVLVDGARHQLDLIRAQAARRKVTIHILVDLIHVLEYIWKAAWCFYQDADPAAEPWVAGHALRILAGEVDTVIAALQTQATDAGLTAQQRGGVDACIGYLTAKREFLGYDTALQAGWPIATGVIEGACRHLIGDRLDITGARWGLEGAEAVLKLRALWSNGDLDAYWRFHRAQEHRRIHQARYQHPPALAA